MTALYILLFIAMMINILLCTVRILLKWAGQWFFGDNCEEYRYKQQKRIRRNMIATVLLFLACAKIAMMCM